MWRTLLWFLQAAVIIAAAIWLVDRPGDVSVDWLGYRIETSVGVLALAVAAVAIVAALLYRFWRGLRRAPRAIGARWRTGRRRKGYKALTLGMVAVAAGDPDEARRQSKRANDLLEEPPLTMLLSAQSAQLDGDDAAAEKYFKSMLEHPETEFLGLRGLVMQALRGGHAARALELTRRAHHLRPDAPWVLQSLFELSAKLGQYQAADTALLEATRRKVMAKDEVKRRRAVILVERARHDLAEGRTHEALGHAREAQKLAPDLVPANAMLARLWIDAGSPGKAQSLIERAWAAAPHPDLARLYLEAKGVDTALDKARALAKLAPFNANHPATHMAQAEADVEAELWGEARRHLLALVEAAPSARAYRLLAEVEEREHGDATAARDWLRRAAGAPDEPAWTCNACGAAAESWSATCRTCGALDTLAWRTPGRPVAALAAAQQPLLPAAEAAPAPGTQSAA